MWAGGAAQCSLRRAAGDGHGLCLRNARGDWHLGRSSSGATDAWAVGWGCGADQGGRSSAARAALGAGPAGPQLLGLLRRSLGSALRAAGPGPQEGQGRCCAGPAGAAGHRWWRGGGTAPGGAGLAGDRAGLAGTGGPGGPASPRPGLRPRDRHAPGLRRPAPAGGSGADGLAGARGAGGPACDGWGGAANTAPEHGLRPRHSHAAGIGRQALAGSSSRCAVSLTRRGPVKEWPAPSSTPQAHTKVVRANGGRIRPCANVMRLRAQRALGKAQRAKQLQGRMGSRVCCCQAWGGGSGAGGCWWLGRAGAGTPPGASCLHARRKPGSGVRATPGGALPVAMAACRGGTPRRRCDRRALKARSSCGFRCVPHARTEAQ
mmetsp:Transcript_60576/g.195106  ORF Transcript_60576/g.195106 Transcript_60576/m.195106 type:complete len:376 (+) Transcript_60576:283-1410(+)